MFLARKRVFTTPRSVQKRRKQLVFRVGTAIVFSFALFVMLGLVSQWQNIRIKEIAVSGNTTVSEEDVRNYIEQQIDGSYVRIFSRANVFLFQPRVIEEDMRAAFKKIKNVEISRDGLQSIVVRISERKPLYVWCDERAEETDACYFLDINGYAFAPAPYFSGDVYFEFHKSFGESGASPIGTYIFPEAEFKPLISFRNALREADLFVRSFEMTEADDYAFVLAEGTKIFFHPRQDFDILVHNLTATFGTEQFTQKRKAGFFLEYIDLRFENKVYYRFR